MAFTASPFKWVAGSAMSVDRHSAILQILSLRSHFDKGEDLAGGADLLSGTIEPTVCLIKSSNGYSI